MNEIIQNLPRLFVTGLDADLGELAQPKGAANDNNLSRK